MIRLFLIAFLATAAFAQQPETSSGGGTGGAQAAVAGSINFSSSGSSLVTSQKACGTMPYSGTITGWTIVGDVSGSIQFDIWKTAFASSLPTIANTIVASAPPTLSSAITATSSVLTGWTTSFSQNDLICVFITSTSGLGAVNLKIQVTH